MNIITYKAPIKPPENQVQIAQQPKTTAIKAGWLVLLLGLILASIPRIGFLMYLISFPVCISSLLLGIVGAAKGKPIRGVLLIISSIAAFFLFYIIPWISTQIAATLDSQK
jgi:hypothetical protein